MKIWDEHDEQAEREGYYTGTPRTLSDRLDTGAMPRRRHDLQQIPSETVRSTGLCNGKG